MGAADGQAAWDLYREIHKAMRYALFGVTAQAGRTDAGDDAGVAALVEEWATVRFLLDGHHAHEDTYVDALVQAHAADLRDELEAGHRTSDAAIAALSVAAEALAAASADERWPLIRAFYLDLGDFTALYLTHLRFEEDRVMPALNARMSDDELAEVTGLIRGSVPPPDMCVFIRYMVPAVDVAERVDMLGGMHQGAPPEIFELFRSAAEGCLSPDDYRAVADAAGF